MALTPLFKDFSRSSLGHAGGPSFAATLAQMGSSKKMLNEKRDSTKSDVWTLWPFIPNTELWKVDRKMRLDEVYPLKKSRAINGTFLRE